MNSTIARDIYRRNLDALGPEGREREIQRIHDLLVRDQREKIEHVYTQYRGRIGSNPVVIMVDVLYDEYGEELGVWEHGLETISEVQQRAFYANGFAPVIFAFSPQDARNILSRRFAAEQADTALKPASPGKVKLFILSMGALSGYDFVAAP